MKFDVWPGSNLNALKPLKIQPEPNRWGRSGGQRGTFCAKLPAPLQACSIYFKKRLEYLDHLNRYIAEFLSRNITQRSRHVQIMLGNFWETFGVPSNPFLVLATSITFAFPGNFYAPFDQIKGFQHAKVNNLIENFKSVGDSTKLCLCRKVF